MIGCLHTVVEMILKCEHAYCRYRHISVVWLFIVRPWSLESQVALLTDLSKNGTFVLLG